MNTILGLDRIDEFSSSLKKKRIGLITNYSGVNSLLKENIEILLNEEITITKIFAPEHGIYGIADGESFEDSIHPVYKIPVISLYGEKMKPSKEDLEHIDILIYDIQDVGLRYYTYLYTLAYSILAASENNKKLIVLDRPNPLGEEIIIGNRIPKNLSSFVGDYELPIRYGLSIGEFGKYFIKYQKIDVDYEVIEMKNYFTDTYFDKTGLEWNVPSPAITSFHSNICYSGGCFFEALNISEGRGTFKPFQIYGAPWINMEKLYTTLLEENFKGFKFRKRAFMPFYSKYKNEVCFGIEFFPEHNKADFIPVSLILMKNIYLLHEDKFKFIKYADVERMDYLTGDPDVLKYLQGKIDLEELLNNWEVQSELFREYVSHLRIYR